MVTPPTPFLAVLVTISLPRVYSTSTVTGAAYVMSRNRHCCGVMSSTMKSSSTDGLPTWMLVYLR